MILIADPTRLRTGKLASCFLDKTNARTTARWRDSHAMLPAPTPSAWRVSPQQTGKRKNDRSY
jgi:hypothetical protein